MSSELETVAVNSGLGSDLFVHFVSGYTYWIINYFYFILFIDINGGLYIHCFFTPHLVFVGYEPFDDFYSTYLYTSGTHRSLFLSNLPKVQFFYITYSSAVVIQLTCNYG